MSEFQQTIPGLIESRIHRYSGKLLLQRKDGWSWKQITWLDFYTDLRNISAFLLDLGFRSGDAVLIDSMNNIDSLYTEFAVYNLGGVVIPIDLNRDKDHIAEIERDFDIKFIFAGNNKDKEAKRLKRSFEAISKLKRVVVYTDENLIDGDIINFKSLLKFGLMKRKQLEDDLKRAASIVLPDNSAIVFYNFNPSGEFTKKEITQQNLIHILNMITEKLSNLSEEDQLFTFLPTLSPFDKLMNYLAIFKGFRMVLSETRKDFFDDILEVKPTVIFETRSGLEDILSKVQEDHGGDSYNEKLRRILGNRVRTILMESLPGKELEDLFNRSGISFIDIPELKNI